MGVLFIKLIALKTWRVSFCLLTLKTISNSWVSLWAWNPLATIPRLNHCSHYYGSTITAPKMNLWCWNKPGSRYITSFFTFWSLNKAKRRLAWTWKVCLIARANSIKNYGSASNLGWVDWSFRTISILLLSHKTLTSEIINCKLIMPLRKSTNFPRSATKFYLKRSLSAFGAVQSLFLSSNVTHGPLFMRNIPSVHMWDKPCWLPKIGSTTKIKLNALSDSEFQRNCVLSLMEWVEKFTRF